VLGVSETAFGVLVQGLHGRTAMDVIDFADSPWSKLQCLEVRRLYDRRFSLGGLGDGVAAFASRLAEHCRARQYDLVIPVNDPAVELAKRARSVAAGLPVALPPDDVARFAHDKRLLLEAAARAGLAVPRYTLLESGAPLADRTLPAFFKPIHTAVVREDRLLKFGARRVATRGRLLDLAREVLPSVPALLQDECPGLGVGYTFLAHEGVPLVEVFHRRLHEPPGGEGGSTYRTTVPPFRDDVLSACRRLLAGIRWSGVGMLELRYDPADDAYAVMELNGRVWGSLALHVAAGCDYPRNLLEYHLDGRREFPERTRVPFRVRNVQRDVAWVCRRAMAPGLSGKRRVALVRDWLADWRHVLLGRESLDFLGWRFMDVFLLHLLTPFVERGFRMRDKAVQWGWAALFTLRRGALRRRFLRSLAGRPTVRLLFVCHGNINRSAFAEAYARTVEPAVAWESAGLHPLPRRRSPRAAELVAREHGVDLREHESRVLTDALARDADGILVFDGRDAQEVRSGAPGARTPIVPLAAFDPGRRGGVVRDPGGASEETYRRVFAQIRRGVDGLRSDLGGLAMANGRARYVIRIDDCHPRMHRENFDRVRRLFARFGVKALAGVIPDCRHDALVRGEAYGGFWREMRELCQEGWTVALHGCTHERLTADGGLLQTNRSSEFAGLPYEQQRERLARGRTILEAHALDTTVFMAPWHSFDWNTVRALRALGFDTLTDGDGVAPYEKGGLVWVPQQLGTPRSVPFGVWTFALHTDGMTEGHYRGLEEFLQRRASQVVSFEEAKRLRVAGPERVAGAAAVGLLRLYRRARVVRARAS
jgi:protein-tyrosine-phosphatase/predicted deacetylase